MKNFVAVDLHVHTPASSCYVGERNRDTYIKILEYYIENEISLIAITDHNTINGYKALMDIKNKLIEKVNKISELANELSIELPENNVINELSLFDKIVILPGVEIEINPGIHMLLIFDQNSNLDKIEKLLVSVGYELEIQGKETGISTNKDILQLLSELNTYSDCLVIGAHVDSSKGLYKCTEGTYRVNILTNERLNGVQYNNQSQADSIEKLINSDPRYKRKSPLGFLKASDFHGNFSANIQKTYFNLEKINFDSLYECFKSPQEKISLTSNPENKKIINSVLEQSNCIAIDKIKNDFEFTPKLCAILNQGFGYIVIGVKDNQYSNIVGTSQDAKVAKAVFEEALRSIQAIKGKVQVAISEYDWIDKYVVIIRLITEHNLLFFLENGESYYLDKKQIKKYSTQELIEKSSKNMLNSYKQYVEFNNKRLDKLYNTIGLLNEINMAYDIFVRFESDMRMLNMLVDIEEVSYKSLDDSEMKSIYGEGSSTVFVPWNDVPRLKDSYYRFTPKGYRIEDYDKEYFGERIILADRGASYYINSENGYDIFNLDSMNPIFILSPKTDSEEISLKYIISWLKSSLCLFYIYSTNLEFEKNLGKSYLNMSIPIIEKKYIERIEVIVEEIIDEEAQFLDTTTKICNEECDGCCENCCKLDQIYGISKEFNKKMNVKEAEIDSIFYNAMEIDGDIIKIINRFLENVDYCTFLETIEEK